MRTDVASARVGRTSRARCEEGRRERAGGDGRREHAGGWPRGQGPRGVSGSLRRPIQIAQGRLRRFVAFLDTPRGGTVIDGSSSPRAIKGLAPEAFCTVHDATSHAMLRTRRPRTAHAATSDNGSRRDVRSNRSRHDDCSHQERSTLPSLLRTARPDIVCTKFLSKQFHEHDATPDPSRPATTAHALKIDTSASSAALDPPWP